MRQAIRWSLSLGGQYDDMEKEQRTQREGTLVGGVHHPSWTSLAARRCEGFLVSPGGSRWRAMPVWRPAVPG